MIVASTQWEDEKCYFNLIQPTLIDKKKFDQHCKAVGLNQGWLFAQKTFVNV